MLLLMSAIETAKAIAKLESLSEDRAKKVLSLIEDLAELEALEDAEDLKDACEALAEMKREGEQARPSGKAQFANEETTSQSAIPYEQLRHELGLD